MFGIMDTKFNLLNKIMKLYIYIILLALIMTSGCMKTNRTISINYIPDPFEESIGGGNEIHVEVNDNRNNKKLSTDVPPLLNLNLNELPKYSFTNAISNNLENKGFKLKNNSKNKIKIDIEKFHVEWPMGTNVTIRSEIDLKLSAYINSKSIISNKRIYTKNTIIASIGGLLAVPKAQEILEKTLNESLKRTLNNPESKNYLNMISKKDSNALDNQDERKTKNRAVFVPIGIIGEITKSQKLIIRNKFLDVLSNDYDLVPQEEYEKAEEAAFQELDYEECTEEQCIRLIQDMLQVENMFQIQLIKDGKDTQVSLTLTDLDRKLVKSNLCEGCNTSSLVKIISSLYKELELKR